MDPPSRPSGARKSVSAQFNRSSAADGASPNLFASTSLSSPDGTIGRHSQSQSHVFLGENNAYTIQRQSSRLQIELSECVETKTVTTTTTTKRAYPPLIIRPPGPINRLDAKEYPLATKPTPQELRCFSYEIDGQTISLQEEESRSISQVKKPLVVLTFFLHMLISSNSQHLLSTIQIQSPPDDHVLRQTSHSELQTPTDL